MSRLVTWAGALSNAYENAGDYVGQAANQLGAAVCNFHQTNPDSFLISSFGRGFLNQTCSAGGFPPVTGGNVTVPAIAGQYQIEFEYEILCPNAPPELKSEILFNCLSPWVQDIVAIDTPMQAGNDGFNIFITTSSPGLHTGSGTLFATPPIGQTGLCTVDPNSIKVTVTDCLYQPPSADVTPPGNEVTIDVDSTVNNTTTTETYNVSFPLTNNRFVFPTTVNVGGTDIEINIDGFSITNENSPGGGGGTVTREPFTDTNRDRRPIVLNDNTSEPEEGGESEPPEELEEVEKEATTTEWVLIEVSSFPRANKVISLHENPDNNSFLAGYFYWFLEVNGLRFRYPEQPIRKARNAYRAPIEAVGYGAYTVWDATIKVTEYSVENTP